MTEVDEFVRDILRNGKCVAFSKILTAARKLDITKEELLSARDRDSDIEVRGTSGGGCWRNIRRWR